MRGTENSNLRLSSSGLSLGRRQLVTAFVTTSQPYTADRPEHSTTIGDVNGHYRRAVLRIRNCTKAK
jgi:hypothetical protein